MDKAIVAGDPSLGEIVYCYQFPSRRDRIKIGYSSRGLRRIVEQSTGFPENPEVLFVIHHKKAAQIERDFHTSLADKQAAVLGREWFSANIKDVLAVSPILRAAARKERWRSIPRLFGAGALFGVGVFAMPLVAMGILEFMGGAETIAGGAVLIDYLKSPFREEISTLQLAWAIVEEVSASDLPRWLIATIMASPTIWVGLAYLSFRRQVA